MLPVLQHGKRRVTRSIPGLSQSDNTKFLYADYPGGLLKTVRVLAVIFQRPMQLLPWTRQFALRGLGEEI
jgi:hypothetical protein